MMRKPNYFRRSDRNSQKVQKSDQDLLPRTPGRHVHPEKLTEDDIVADILDARLSQHLLEFFL